MKRTGNLKDKIIALDNIALATHNTFKGHRWRKDVISFSNDYHFNIGKIRDVLKNETVTFGNYSYFRVFDPKERLICAASLIERIIHHSIMNVCHDYFEKKQIFDSYATRKGKGTYKAIDRVKSFTKQFPYFAKLDIRKYFDSIDHGVLNTMLMSMFKDEWLLRIFKCIIDSYFTTKGKGIPIGNLSSQYFANLYLSGLDHYMKENLKVKAYVRYMDDVVILASDKSILIDWVRVFKDYANENLHLELKPPIIGKVENGIPFLGYRVFPYHLQLSNRSKRRFRRKIRLYKQLWEDGYLSESAYSKRLSQLCAFTLHADCKAFRIKCIESIG